MVSWKVERFGDHWNNTSLPSAQSGLKRNGEIVTVDDVQTPQQHRSQLALLLTLAVVVGRYLEEGRTQDAEAEKNRLEQAQRERRRQRDEERVVYSPKWFM